MLTIVFFIVVAWILEIALLIIFIVAVASHLLRRISRNVEDLSGPDSDKAAASLAATAIGMVLGYRSSRKRQ